MSGPKIRCFDGVYYLFYIAGTRWKIVDGRAEPVYRIRMAVSRDGTNWKKHGKDLIAPRIEPDEAQASPDVHYHDGRYHMFFCYRYSTGYRSHTRGYRIGYAHSDDLSTWRREDDLAGLVFDPREHALLDGCREFAQSPQTLALDDGLRVYFSTRAPDAAGGKYRSHVSFAEFEDDLTTIRRVARHQVLPLGTLGAFDEHGIFPINVLSVGSEIWGYTTGWNRRVSVSVDTAIGLVVSRDGGETFLRPHGDGPVLGPSLLEPFLVGDAFVLRVGDLFHMWYIFGQRWVRETTDSPPDRVYKIAHAVSEDGQTWVKNDGVAIIPDVLGADECQALPSVVAYNGLYHMVFCYRDVHG
ncbi:Uncharacterized protein MT1551, partial [Durusdinium trenchii]